jgi:hypothetical protein
VFQQNSKGNHKGVSRVLGSDFLNKLDAKNKEFNRKTKLIFKRKNPLKILNFNI